MTLVDSHGRRINYLRLSVTDRCNLRCQYCMPAEGVPKLCHSDILSYEDLRRVAAESVTLGIEKIRITGGEPLVRKGLVGFIGDLAGIAGLKEIVLTTNGILLEEMAVSLRQAGLQRLNVSLDSLRPDTFAAITRGGDIRKVFQGMDAAGNAGFPPLKINMVVMRGINDNELLDFAALTLQKPYNIRFIEYMPTADAAAWKALCVTGTEVLQRIGSRYSLEPLSGAASTGPARNFHIPGALGTIGIISPISNHFCANCNRIRITASGFAKGCLFGGHGIDLKPHLRCDDNESLRAVLRELVLGKPDRHHLLSPQPVHGAFSMSQIGG